MAEEVSRLGLLGAIQTGEIAFEQIHGYSRWEFLRRNPKQAEIFNEAMRSLSAARTPAVTAGHDWSRFSVIADIGGGIGTQLVDILNAHPRCKGILFDQPEVIAQAIPHDRIERISGSFFERVPFGADAYILRSVIHDWEDAEAIEILKTVRVATKPESCVILIELIIDDAPQNAHAKWQDLLMMVTAGGQERAAAEYQRLLETAGLELEQIAPTLVGLNLIQPLARGLESLRLLYWAMQWSKSKAPFLPLSNTFSTRCLKGNVGALCGAAIDL